MAYPTWRSGMRVTASRLRGMQWQRVEQGSDLTVNNSTTYQLTNLAIPAETGGVYRFIMDIGYTTFIDVKIEWDDATSGNGNRNSFGIGRDTTGNNLHTATDVNVRVLNTVTDAQIGYSSAGNGMAYHEDGEFEAGGDGDITVMFAQNTADASDSVFLARSRLYYVRID